jgi:hypothetical protein
LTPAYEAFLIHAGEVGFESDREFHAYQPELVTVLRAHLDESEDLYIEWTPWHVQPGKTLLPRALAATALHPAWQTIVRET